MKEVALMHEKKPEWFELVDGDAPSAQVTKINKKLPAIAVLAAGSVMALGTFFSSASESGAQTVSSTEQSLSVAAESPVATTPAPVATNSTSDNSVSPVIATNNPNQGGVQAPGLANGGDDDDDDDDDRRGHGGDDDDDDRRGHGGDDRRGNHDDDDRRGDHDDDDRDRH